MAHTAMKPLVIAIGTTAVSASENPFAMSELPSGYMLSDSSMEDNRGDGMGTHKGKKDKDGKCGEGKCGKKIIDAKGDGKIDTSSGM